MKPDFEKELARHQIKPIPAQWRTEILAAAREARQATPQRARGVEAQCAPILKALRELFWPSPWAWGGIAGIWAVLLSLGSVAQWNAPAVEGSFASRAEFRFIEKRQEWIRQELGIPALATKQEKRGHTHPVVGPRTEGPCDPEITGTLPGGLEKLIHISIS